MPTRSGFARLLPLMALTGLVAGTLALMASARRVQAPAPRVMPLTRILLARYDGGCSAVPEPVPAHGIVDAYGRRWEIADIPGHALVGADLRNAEWFGVDMHRAAFTACDFRGCDLRAADLSGASFWECDFTGADLTDADLTGTTYDDFTNWPAGFDPQARGAQVMWWKH